MNKKSNAFTFTCLVRVRAALRVRQLLQRGEPAQRTGLTDSSRGGSGSAPVSSTVRRRLGRIRFPLLPR